MFVLKENLAPKQVIWAKKNIYYDRPDIELTNKTAMYLITMVNEDYFLGCPLTTSCSNRNLTILSSSNYPLKRDSRINNCLYKLETEDVLSIPLFEIDDKAFLHFQRELYKKIVLGCIYSPTEYNDLFVEELLKTYKPKPDSILVYPSEEKVFRYYYLYDESDEYYSLLNLTKEENNYYLASTNIVAVPKSIRFFDFYTNHNLTRDEIEQSLGAGGFQKKIGKLN